MTAKVRDDRPRRGRRSARRVFSYFRVVPMLSFCVLVGLFRALLLANDLVDPLRRRVMPNVKCVQLLARLEVLQVLRVRLGRIRHVIRILYVRAV